MLTSTPRSTPSMPKKRRGDRASWEARRLEAGRLFRRGLSPAEVGRELGAPRQSVHRWYHQWREGGASALRAAPVAGRPSAVTSPQLRRVERILLKGALASGFPTELWTLERVAVVIERVTGVGYGKSNVWLLLRKLGWTRQRPTRRAAARDEQAVTRWVKEEWPRVKKPPDGVMRGSSSRTRVGSP